eukprot:m.1306858 g.1306858  ORF g.1306858 m.1306858 type:complete len:203 (+) comp24817_c0_seq10:515-1123(+)
MSQSTTIKRRQKGLTAEQRQQDGAWVHIVHGGSGLLLTAQGLLSGETEQQLERGSPAVYPAVVRAPLTDNAATQLWAFTSDNRLISASGQALIRGGYAQDPGTTVEVPGASVFVVPVRNADEGAAAARWLPDARGVLAAVRSAPGGTVADPGRIGQVLDTKPPPGKSSVAADSATTSPRFGAHMGSLPSGVRCLWCVCCNGT